MFHLFHLRKAECRTKCPTASPLTAHHLSVRYPSEKRGMNTNRQHTAAPGHELIHSPHLSPITNHIRLVCWAAQWLSGWGCSLTHSGLWLAMPPLLCVVPFWYSSSRPQICNHTNWHLKIVPILVPCASCKSAFKKLLLINYYIIKSKIHIIMRFIVLGDSLTLHFTHLLFYN